MRRNVDVIRTEGESTRVDQEAATGKAASIVP